MVWCWVDLIRSTFCLRYPALRNVDSMHEDRDMEAVAGGSANADLEGQS